MTHTTGPSSAYGCDNFSRLLSAQTVEIIPWLLSSQTCTQLSLLHRHTHGTRCLLCHTNVIIARCEAVKCNSKRREKAKKGKKGAETIGESRGRYAYIRRHGESLWDSGYNLSPHQQR